MSCKEPSEIGNTDQENARGEGKNDFIVGDDDGLEEDGSVDREDGSGNEEDEEDGDDNMFDSVCCICDEGGSILCCDGVCMRSFHATPRAAREADSQCVSLGFTTKEVEAMQIFKCQNCQHKQHQCYSCGLLGSSDKESGAAEVFQCVNATCGYFYHPGCVAKRLHRDDEDASKARQKDIAAGEPFTCPLHMCFVCGQPGDKTDPELRMAVCRRCPKAYHKKCLPRKIAFEDEVDEDMVQRAWDNLLADRILIYCLKHEIDEDLGTPRRNHIKFPAVGKIESQPFRMMRNKLEPKSKKPSVVPSRLGPAVEPKRTLPDNHSCKTNMNLSKPKCTNTLRNTSAEKKPVSTKAELKSPQQSGLVKPITIGKLAVEKSVVKLDSDSQRRILKIIEDASSQISMGHIIQKHEKVIPVPEYKQKVDPCKSITQGKVDGTCKAIREATKKLDTGFSIEDAKAICDPKILHQSVKWKSKLRVYLAPFIYGMRYTSFGRHFTKTDKLQEIAEKIHWYVNSNDTIVDFCCGANEFSSIMKKKLESTGKTCNYKNYDLFPPKDDFCFEKKSWFDVQPKELLLPGSQLIIGLNPPFGVKASRANQFINKALEFKPKLLILIVPQETERLDKKKTRYDLIWEDRDRLCGKSFYLPGSVDVNDKQIEDWNNVPPILYLWSRSDWTARHKAIANKHGHLHGGERSKGNHEQSIEKFEQVTETKADNLAITDEPERLTENLPCLKRTVLKDYPSETHPSDLKNKNVNGGDSRKKRHSEEIYAKENAESSRDYKRPRSPPFNPRQGLSLHSPVSASDGYPSPSLRYRRSSADLDIVDPRIYGDGIHSRESQPRGYEDRSSGIMEINNPANDHNNQSIFHGGTRNEVPIPGGLYDDRVRIHSPQIDGHHGGRWSVETGLHVDFPRVPGVWSSSYMRGSSGHEAIQPYGESEQRIRQSAFPMEAGYGRMSSMSGLNGYDPRLGNPNHLRMSGYDLDPRHHPGTGVYNQPHTQGYPGNPLGFASRPVGPFHHPHSSSGGWIND